MFLAALAATLETGCGRQPFVLFPCLLVYFAIESRWEAYSRRKNYEELRILHELREKNIITAEEFDEKRSNYWVHDAARMIAGHMKKEANARGLCRTFN